MVTEEKESKPTAEEIDAYRLEIGESLLLLERRFLSVVWRFMYVKCLSDDKKTDVAVKLFEYSCVFSHMSVLLKFWKYAFSK
ncbi:hypothetical protein [Pyrobaculum islandicum]|uniref:hypothetical protein n=1 Tax=Pyrobaculum islandicum TaxID=2277 RepID=UPI000B184358|nr:hypothetical protein [Pyrobaculum islandicum]